LSTVTTPPAAVVQKPQFGWGVAKTITALALALAAWCWTGHRRSGMAYSATPQVAKAAATPTQDARLSQDNLAKAIPGMKETNDLIINWSIAILGGTLAVSVMAKGARILDQNWCLVPLPAAWVLLLTSLNEGYDFKRALTFQISKGEYVLPELNLQLYLQLDFFRATLLVLALWGGCYLFCRFAMLEDRSQKGG